MQLENNTPHKAILIMDILSLQIFIAEDPQPITLKSVKLRTLYCKH